MSGKGKSYNQIHRWVYLNWGKAYKCELCGRAEKRKYEWSNIGHKYNKFRNEWKMLCVPCHRKADVTDELREKFRIINTGIKRPNREARVCGEKNGESIYYDSVTKASIGLNLLRTSIHNCLSGKSKTSGGYKWTYD